MHNQIAETLIDVAVTTGVDVVTKQSKKPAIRAVGTAYRVYSLVEPVSRITGAIRIAAYTDAVAIICQELIVHLASRELSNRLLLAQTINYEVIVTAEKHVLSIDFERDVPAGIDYFRAPIYLLESDLLSRDYLEHGRGLAEIAHDCISHGVQAFLKARELVEHEEARLPRKLYNWDRPETWLHRFNRDVGFLLWRPPSEIGLGSSRISEERNYYGTFRRNSAEGYGCIEWNDGSRYFGQIFDGMSCGYGGFEFSDGGMYFGYRPKNHFRKLGAYITSSRDRIIVGIGKDNFPESYGRQIGIANGVESTSGFWSDGKLKEPIESLAKTNLTIARRMDTSFTQELKAEYEHKASVDQATLDQTDANLVRMLRPFI